MPHTVTVTKEVWNFNELTDSAKERARQWFRDGENELFEADCTFDDAATIAELMGIDIRKRAARLMGGGTRYEPSIYYSGFYSQGDGASFEGSYSYVKGSVAKVVAHAPTDTELHRIARELADVQRRYFYTIGATITHRSRYCHSLSMDIEAQAESREMSDSDIETVTQCMRDFADWIFKQLRDDYEWRMADEQIDESILANEYEFEESGRIAR